MSRAIPLYESAAAGAGEHYEGDHAESVIAIPEDLEGDLFAVRARGDSMEPGILDGDIVIFRRLEAGWPKQGRIVLATLDHGEAVIKRYRGDPRRLGSDNPAHPDIEIERVTRIYGLALRVQREL